MLKALACQQGAWLLLALALAPVDRAAALSIAAGSAVFCLPSAYHALLAFRYSGARTAELAVRAFYKGELGKFILAAVLFAAALQALPTLRIELLAATYAVATIVHGWISARCIVRR